MCFSHVGYGPLKLPSLAPGQVLQHGLLPRTPSTLTAGQWELDWHESLANVWAVKEGSYFLDPITIAFHDFFGLDQNGRTDHPRNEDMLFIEGRDGVDTIDITESGSEVRSLAFTLQNNITCGITWGTGK